LFRRAHALDGLCAACASLNSRCPMSPPSLSHPPVSTSSCLTHTATHAVPTSPPCPSSAPPAPHPQDLNARAQLPLPDCAVDAVTCASGLQYLARPEWVAAEVARVLRPGAYTVCTHAHTYTHAHVRMGLSTRHDHGRTGTHGPPKHASRTAHTHRARRCTVARQCEGTHAGPPHPYTHARTHAAPLHRTLPRCPTASAQAASPLWPSARACTHTCLHAFPIRAIARLRRRRLLRGLQ
jgi:hypothetical protein